MKTDWPSLADWVILFASGLSLPSTVVRALSGTNEHLSVMVRAILFMNVIVSS
jgi:hypothetical protein